MTFEEFYDGDISKLKDISNLKQSFEERKEVFEIQELLKDSKITEENKQKFWTLFKSWSKKAFEAGKK